MIISWNALVVGKGVNHFGDDVYRRGCLVGILYRGPVCYEVLWKDRRARRCVILHTLWREVRSSRAEWRRQVNYPEAPCGALET